MDEIHSRDAGEPTQSVRVEFDAVCRRFQAELQSGSRPNVDAFLADLLEPRRSELRQVLVALTHEFSSAAQGNLGPAGSDLSSRANSGMAETSVHPGSTHDVAAEATSDWVETPEGLRGRDREVSPSAEALAAAPAIPGYVILGVLGRGGMGIVYRARHTGLKRVVALKMIQAGGLDNDEILTRFRAEAEAVAAFQHPNIVQIYEAGEHEGRPYCALEYVDGSSLQDQWDYKPLTADRAASLVETLANAMYFAHQKGIIHRDLKPANILLTREGVPKISDFGLVKRVEDEDSGQTKTGMILGTPSYMAPEQAWGEKTIGPGADIYALGAILYALITGRPPFAGTSSVDTVLQARTQEPLPPSKLQPKTPRDLETICLKCLQKSVEKRYQTAEELARDLRRFQEGRPISARPVGRPERVLRWCLRNPVLATVSAATGLLSLCLAIGGPVAAVMINQKKEQAESATELAEHRKEQAEQKESEANAARKEADSSAELAAKQGNLALDALGALVYEVQEQLKQPNMQPLRQSLLNTAMTRLDRVAEAAGLSRQRNVLLSAAHRRLGDIYLEIGQSRKALDQYQRCSDIVEELHNAGKLGNPYHNLSMIYLLLGDASSRLDRFDDAQRHYQRALEVRRDWKNFAPANRMIDQNIAAVYGKLGQTALQSEDLPAAREYFRLSAELRGQWAAAEPDNAEAQREFAGAEAALGNVCVKAGELDAAETHLQQALQILQSLALAEPANIAISANIGLFHSRLGELYLRKQEPQAAREHYDQAVARLKEASAQDLEVSEYRRYLAQAYYGLGTAHRPSNAVEAQKQFERALEIRCEDMAGDPQDSALKAPLMLSQARCGNHREAAALAKELSSDGAPNDPKRLYLAACGYALCAEAVSLGKAAADAGAERGLQEQYAQQAVAMLRGAVAHGYRSQVEAQMDPDLAFVRPRKDFCDVVTELEATIRREAGAEPAP